MKKKAGVDSLFRKKKNAVFVLTGTPGTGKTTVAKALAKKFEGTWLNELDFAMAKNLGKRSSDGEWEIPVEKLAKALSRDLEQRKKPLFLEGHVLCETKVPVDNVVVLECPPQVLEQRLTRRRYAPLKVLENVWAEQNRYCLKKARQTFSRKVKKVSSDQTIRRTLQSVEKALGLLK